MRRNYQKRELDSFDAGHRAINYSYLDMYEERVNHEKRAYEAFQKSEKQEVSEAESKKPAFFQKDKKLDAANKELYKN